MTFSAHTTQRRWLAAVAAVGVLLTCAALAMEWKPRGVYWSRVTIKFLVPFSSANINVIKATSGSLVRAAGAVSRIVDPSGGKLRLADDDVTLASEGIEHGTTVTLPNSGGQWSYGFALAQLQVEAVGTSGAEVTARMTTAIDRIHVALAGLQPTTEVAKRNLITLLQIPSNPTPIYYQAANRPRALLATVGLGLLLTVMARSALRLAFRRRARSPAPGAQPAPAHVPSGAVLVASEPG